MIPGKLLLAGFAPNRTERTYVSTQAADRVARKALCLRLVALHLRQSIDPTPLKAAMQGQPGQARDRRLEAIKAIVPRQESAPPKGDDDSPLRRRQNRRAPLFATDRRIGDRLRHF